MFHLLHILTSTWDGLSFHFSYSNGCIVVSRVILICLSMTTNNVKHFFSYTYWLFLCIFLTFYLCFLTVYWGRRNRLFVFLLSCMTSLYTLDRSPISEVCIANIFSQYVACLFIFLFMSFKEQKLYIFIKFTLSFFPIMVYTFCILYKKYLFNSW